jgi:diacylglycerol O-acyltransferase
MDRLTTLDAGFLEAEDADHHISLAVGGVSVLEGPMPAFDSLVAGIAEKTSAVPRLRQVLRTHLMDMQPPEWVDDPTFDVSHHVHRAAIPAPGDDQSLFRFTADIMERRLDRERPLWECWIVEGLANGRWAVLMKMHHCIADGISTMSMLCGLSDDGPGETFASEINTDEQPHAQSQQSRHVSFNPVKWASGLWNLASSATNAAALVVEGAVEIAGGIVRPAPETSLVGPVTTMRRYSAARVNLDGVLAVADKFGVTLNDVALAAITDSFRAALVRRGKPPRRNSLRTLVPVSLRSVDAVGVPDNRVSVMLPFLPVDREDPVAQLQAVHRRLSRTKASGQRQAGQAIIAAAGVLPFPFTARMIRLLTGMPQRGIVTLATNVPGPRQRLRLMDREVVSMLPIPPIALQLRTAIAILSYADSLVFGIMADYDAAPDVDEIAHGIEQAIAQLGAKT